MVYSVNDADNSSFGKYETIILELNVKLCGVVRSCVDSL